MNCVPINWGILFQQALDPAVGVRLVEEGQPVPVAVAVMVSSLPPFYPQLFARADLSSFIFRVYIYAFFFEPKPVFHYLPRKRIFARRQQMHRSWSLRLWPGTGVRSFDVVRIPFKLREVSSLSRGLGLAVASHTPMPAYQRDSPPSATHRCVSPLRHAGAHRISPRVSTRPYHPFGAEVPASRARFYMPGAASYFGHPARLNHAGLPGRFCPVEAACRGEINPIGYPAKPAVAVPARVDPGSRVCDKPRAPLVGFAQGLESVAAGRNSRSPFSWQEPS